jgi:hypothetical protein
MPTGSRPARRSSVRTRTWTPARLTVPGRTEPARSGRPRSTGGPCSYAPTEPTEHASCPARPQQQRKAGPRQEVSAPSLPAVDRRAPAGQHPPRRWNPAGTLARGPLPGEPFNATARYGQLALATERHQRTHVPGAAGRVVGCHPRGASASRPRPQAGRWDGTHPSRCHAPPPPPRLDGCYLVDPASNHMLVLKIKPCMSKYKRIIQ